MTASSFVPAFGPTNTEAARSAMACGTVVGAGVGVEVDVGVGVDASAGTTVAGGGVAVGADVGVQVEEGSGVGLGVGVSVATAVAVGVIVAVDCGAIAADCLTGCVAAVVTASAVAGPAFKIRPIPHAPPTRSTSIALATSA
jgi:hypothetical protein